jgi:uncharacterized protein YfiM (DUF2279 family)
MLGFDKVLHFAIAFVLGGTTYYAKNIKRLKILFYASIIIFVGKEVYDVFKSIPTGFSWLDLFFDIFGYFFGMAVYVWISKVLKVVGGRK